MTSRTPDQQLMMKEWDEIVREVQRLPENIQAVIVKRLKKHEKLPVNHGLNDKASPTVFVDGIGKLRRMLVEKINEYMD